MPGSHEPREVFVEELQSRIGISLRQRALRPVPSRWVPQSPAGLALAAAVLVAISMAIGGGVVAAAYEAQDAQQRSTLVATYSRLAELARSQLALDVATLKSVEQRSAIGIERPETVLDAGRKVTESQARVRRIESELAEVQISGREPQDAVSAPLVSGRDFVSERWRIDQGVPMAASEVERRRARGADIRFQVGMARAIDVEEAETSLVEVEAAIEAIQRKLEIRRDFLKGTASAAASELRVLQVEAEQRRTTFQRRIDLGRTRIKDLKAKVDIGTLAPIELAQAELRLQELQLGLTKADYDLALIHYQMAVK